MADEEQEAPTANVTARGRRRRIKWTNDMNSKLLECKKKAKELATSNDPPRNTNGRKKGYMQMMKELWDESGYAELDLTSQNLRDQASHLEKTLGNVRVTISNSMGRTEDREDVPSETEFISLSDMQTTQQVVADLHLNLPSSPQVPMGCPNTPMNASANDLLQLAQPTLASLVMFPGDFRDRAFDTRSKQRPTGADIKDVNTVVRELIKRNVVPDPSENPFGYLWMVNCIVYSVIVAFFVSKGWKKSNGKRDNVGRSELSEKAKEEFERQASKIRANLSKAKAEIERIKSNRKITRKGKKNRAALLKECKTLSVANLVAYMEKEKAKLRKMKRCFWITKKNEDTRRMNREFQLDPGRVYANFKDSIESQGDCERPTFVHGKQDKKTSERLFTDVNEASNFWKELWETEGDGNIEAEWLDEIRCAIRENVLESMERSFELSPEQARKIILKKRNWSAPGPDRIVNFWWKRVDIVHEGIARAFRSISQEDQEIPLWFAEGKSSLLPKPGEFTSANQRPITCLNTMYKWFTSCVLVPVDRHLVDNRLMEREQRGAKQKCSGTIDNLLIDRMVCVDSQRGRRNVSMAWIDVRKAYDSVDHRWLKEMFSLHRFPKWVGNLIDRLSAKWNTRIVVRTQQGLEVSERIFFRRGLPQGDALCPKLFMLCLNPVAWKLRGSEGYRLSKPMSAKITNLLYVDDLKVYAASEGKLERVLRDVKGAMEDIGLHWNEKKCAVAHVIRGVLQEFPGMAVGEQELVKSLKDDTLYKFLGVLENTKQEDTLVLENAARSYLQRLSVIWSSPLSDHHKVVATNQFALPVLTYFMWTQVWPIAELQRIDRDTRKIITDNGGKHPSASTDLLYLPRQLGGRGLKSVEEEYRVTKVKAAVKLYQNTDPTIALVRKFEDKAKRNGRRSLVCDAQLYAEELGLKLELRFPIPSGTTSEGESVEGNKIGPWVKGAVVDKRRENIRQQRWQGKMVTARWEDEGLDRECFSWLSVWNTAPTHVVAGINELYEQLLPTKLYYSKKTKTSVDPDIMCRMCGQAQESVAHVLAGCKVLAQTKYLTRHNAALKILFFELLKDYHLIESIPPWYSPIQPKPVYENHQVTAYWDVPVYAYNTEVRANRIDARIVDRGSKTITLLEMSCPWMENRDKKDEEKVEKYTALRWELKQQFPGFEICQVNVIVDVLGGYSKSVGRRIKGLLGVKRGRDALRRMQKVVLSASLNIARNFKILC